MRDVMTKLAQQTHKGSVSINCMDCQQKVAGSIPEAKQDRQLYWAEYTHLGIEVTQGPYCKACWFKGTPFGGNP